MKGWQRWRVRTRGPAHYHPLPDADISIDQHAKHPRAFTELDKGDCVGRIQVTTHPHVYFRQRVHLADSTGCCPFQIIAHARDTDRSWIKLISGAARALLQEQF